MHTQYISHTVHKHVLTTFQISGPLTAAAIFYAKFEMLYMNSMILFYVLQYGPLTEDVYLLRPIITNHCNKTSNEIVTSCEH